MHILPAQLKKIFPANKNHEMLADTLNRVLPKYQINTVNRIAGFLAQCGHESSEFNILRENLNYSAARLLEIFPKYFNKAQAEDYQRQPSRIANRVYANRMGNGAESTGDGFRYMGRGALQLTGKNNYTAFAKSLDRDLSETVAYLETLDGAIESACWYWHTNSVNRTCDADDIRAMTRLVNGGYHGLADRQKYYELAKSVLAGAVVTNIVLETVKLGSTGDTVKAVQRKLELSVDGEFWPAD
jgi:putative chitinase